MAASGSSTSSTPTPAPAPASTATGSGSSRNSSSSPSSPAPIRSKAQQRWMGWAAGQGIIKRNKVRAVTAATPSINQLPERVGPRPGMPGAARTAAPKAFRSTNTGLPRNLAARKPRLRTKPMRTYQFTRSDGARN